MGHEVSHGPSWSKFQPVLDASCTPVYSDTMALCQSFNKADYFFLNRDVWSYSEGQTFCFFNIEKGFYDSLEFVCCCLGGAV